MLVLRLLDACMACDRYLYGLWRIFAWLSDFGFRCVNVILHDKSSKNGKASIENATGWIFSIQLVKFDSDYCIDVRGDKIEIYINRDSVDIDDMKSLFYDLFGTVIDELSYYWF